MKNFFSNPDPLNRNIPYTEKNFAIGIITSIIHTFILIFFAELGDKTFIMLFILQLRTNKVTIFYSALFAEILMNILIEYLGILFFVIYGVFLILSGFKTSEDTFEEEFEMIEEMHKQRINRTPSMILGLEEEEENIKQNEKDKYNLESVNKYNEKSYTPIIKKELTIIPESDISREDSIFNEDNLLSTKKKDNKDLEEDDSWFILNKKSSTGFRLNLKKPKKESNNTNNENKNKENDLNNNTEGNEIIIKDDGEIENEDIEDQDIVLIILIKM